MVFNKCLEKGQFTWNSNRVVSKSDQVKKNPDNETSQGTDRHVK